MATEIPKLEGDIDYDAVGKPGWMAVVNTAGQALKPIILCNCGRYTGIALHHVHADGTVTASYYHKRGTNFSIGEDPDGCEWHVWLKLLDYNLGDFPPEPH